MIPIIKTLQKNTDEIVSGGGTLIWEVEFSNYVNKFVVPTLLFGNQEIEDRSKYIHIDFEYKDEHTFTYICNFPPTEEERIISLTICAEGEGGEMVCETCSILQKAPTGTDADKPIINREIIVTNTEYSLGNEYVEELCSFEVNYLINEEFGRFEVINNNNWIYLQRHYVDDSTYDYNYYYRNSETTYIEVQKNDTNKIRRGEIEIQYYNVNNELVTKKYVVFKQGEKDILPLVISFDSNISKIYKDTNDTKLFVTKTTEYTEVKFNVLGLNQNIWYDVDDLKINKIGDTEFDEINGNYLEYYQIFAPKNFEYEKVKISINSTELYKEFDVTTYQSPKIIVYTEGFEEESTQLSINVEYVSAKEINNPIVKIDNFVTDVEYTITDLGYIKNYIFTFDNTTYDRDISITFSMIGERDENISYVYKIVQRNEVEEEPPFVNGANISPIWKDIKYTFTDPIVEFSIRDYYSGEILYRGRSYQNPNLDPNSIYINRIVENWISTPNFNPYLTQRVRGGYGIFDLLDANGNILHNYQFVNDWSYNINEFKAGLLSRPILNNTYGIRGQYLPFSIFGDDDINDVVFGYKLNNGRDYQNNVNVSNDVLHVWNDEVKSNAYKISFAYIGKMKIPFEEPCKNRYVLYYVNPFGGYDWFNHIAKSIQKDNLQTYNYIQNVDNTTINFGKNRYLTEINKTFEFTTKWLKEDESNRMWYLLESNKVWLHDVIEDRIYPVVIRNTSVDYKQKTPNQKIIQYTFNVELSQQRTRK